MSKYVIPAKITSNNVNTSIVSMGVTHFALTRGRFIGKASYSLIDYTNILYHNSNISSILKFKKLGLVKALKCVLFG